MTHLRAAVWRTSSSFMGTAASERCGCQLCQCTRPSCGHARKDGKRIQNMEIQSKNTREVSSAENLSNTSYWHHDIYWLMFQPLLWREQKWVWNILNALRPSPKHTRLKTWGGWMCAPKTSGGAAFLTPSSYHVESFGWDQTLRHTEWFVVWTRKSWTKQVLPEIVPIACKDFQQLSQQCCTSYRGLCYRPICHFVISPFGLWIETCWWIIVSHMYVPST